MRNIRRLAPPEGTNVVVMDAVRHNPWDTALSILHKRDDLGNDAVKRFRDLLVQLQFRQQFD